MTPEALFEQYRAGFAGRRFSAGLLMAMIDFYDALGVPSLGVGSFDELLARFPRQETTNGGKRANTLIVARPDGSTLSLRPFYNAAEKFFRAEHKRFDYPSCAPHATQAWIDYPAWLDALATYSPEQLRALREQVAAHVLDALASQAFDPSTIKKEPPLFTLLLEGFDMGARKEEKSGAAFQGVVFGFLRADNPHLQIEIEKVRTGSKRLQRVGDIDGWDGRRLAISAEVKQYDVRPDDLPDIEGFAHETGRRGALGLLVALGFAPDARLRAENLGLRALDLDEMTRIVSLWDPLKQRTAVSSFVFFANHIEKNAALSRRLDDFLGAAAE